MISRSDAFCRACVGGTLLLGFAAWACATEADGQDQAVSALSQESKKSSLTPPSLESAIAWTDQLYFHQWRIQRHVDTQEHRLLNEDGDTCQTGDFRACLERLEQIKREQHLPPMQGKAVLLLHGLAAPRWSMQLLARHLREECGYCTFVFEYASTRSTVDSQARGLANVVKSLEGITEINFVGHSMGNIVIRRYLAGDNTPAEGWRPDPRIGRIVMIAPPNHGSITANRLSDNALFQQLLGKSAQQLGSEWRDLEQRLAIPSVEFGIIAGGFGNRLGLSLLVPGDDDGRITVETTRLAGATDFTVVPAVHEFIANDPRVFALTRQFLISGYFNSLAKRQSIPRVPQADKPGHQTR